LNLFEIFFKIKVTDHLELGNKTSERVKQGFHDGALVDDRVQWVSHLMRDGAVDQAQELSFSLRCVVKNLLGNV
jgi:hypothetical protein|tara:strand:- start:266 stop:487 length:222 start_codon:yes stop_codon:yes gene_type:complete